MFEAIFTIFALIGAACSVIFLIVVLYTIFYLDSKQLFGDDDNEK